MAPPATAIAIPNHCSTVGRSLRKADARTIVHSGYRAVSGIATLAFAPFSRQANTAQFPSPLTAPAIKPTSITRALTQVRHALVIQKFFDLKRIANPAPAMAAIETAM